MELVAHYACECGEGPLWHPEEQALYWFDIPLGRLFRLDHRTGRHEMLYDGLEAGTGRIGATVLDRDGALLLLGDGCRVDRWDPHTRTLKPVLEPIEGESRFNDAFVDPAGRIYSGSIVRGTWEDGDPGRLYRIDPDGTRTVVDEGFNCPNGMALSPDGRHLYFASTTEGKIYRYDHDADTGELSARATIFDEDGSMPDGMTIDTGGRLWSARWGHHHLWVHEPDGREVHRVRVPAETTSSVCFAGDDLDVAYITTAGGNGDLNAPNDTPDGGLFRATLKHDGEVSRGLPDHRARLG